MNKIFNNFLNQIKEKQIKKYKTFLEKGLTWKTLNPKSLQELKTES